MKRNWSGFLLVSLHSRGRSQEQRNICLNSPLSTLLPLLRSRSASILHAAVLHQAGKEKDEAIAHHIAAHLSPYCSSPLAGVWCRRRWWPQFALRGLCKKLQVGVRIAVEWRDDCSPLQHRSSTKGGEQISTTSQPQRLTTTRWRLPLQLRAPPWPRPPEFKTAQSPTFGTTRLGGRISTIASHWPCSWTRCVWSAT